MDKLVRNIKQTAVFLQRYIEKGQVQFDKNGLLPGIENSSRQSALSAGRKDFIQEFP